MEKKQSKKPEELTDCWHDDERMDFLFSDFPADVTSNPEHWKTKFDFWVKLITDLCDNATIVCIDYNTVCTWVERNGRKPLGFQTVWDSMIQKKVLVHSSEYIGDITRNSSWFGWGVNTFVRKPTFWVAGKVLSPLKTLSPVKSFSSRSGIYICPKSFQNKAQSLVDIMQSSSETAHGNLHVLSFDDLKKLSSDVITEEKDLELLLLALEREKKIEIFDLGNKMQNSAVTFTNKFIKFLKSSDANVAPVNDADIGVLKLERTKSQLQTEISNLYEKQTKLQQTARDSLKKGQRIIAKDALRQKQRTHQGLMKKETSLDNINQLLDRIQQCKTDQMIMEAYRAGVDAYNATKKANVLIIDAVDDTMNDVNDMLIDDNEISTSLAAPMTGNDISDDELEKELMELVSDKDDELLSNQTDADIAKLVSGMGSLSTGTTQTKLHKFPEIPTNKTSPRKKSSQKSNKTFSHFASLPN